MTHGRQQDQQRLLEQALADPRITAASEAYDAVRVYVPEPVHQVVATTHSTTTIVTQAPPAP